MVVKRLHALKGNNTSAVLVARETNAYGLYMDYFKWKRLENIRGMFYTSDKSFSVMPVEVVPYNNAWKQWFNELREPIWAKINDIAVELVHVGSTSIEGMSAKPVIDMDIVIDDWSKFQSIVNQLNILGYMHVGNLGINEREAFKLVKGAKHSHNLYVCHRDSVAYRNHVLLRKRLLENPEDFRRYIDLKIRLADAAIDVDEYCRLKTNLILEFLEKEGLSKWELDEIRLENLS
jgi:GrpB-like predicted nucleotidyltransferase (UPF0157 family)